MPFVGAEGLSRPISDVIPAGGVILGRKILNAAPSPKRLFAEADGTIIGTGRAFEQDAAADLRVNARERVDGCGAGKV